MCTKHEEALQTPGISPLWVRLPFLLPASSRFLWAFLIVKSSWLGFLSMVWLKGIDAKRNKGQWQGCWWQRQVPQWWMNLCVCCIGGMYILQWVRKLLGEYPENLNEDRLYWFLFAPSCLAVGFNSNKTFWGSGNWLVKLLIRCSKGNKHKPS